MRLHRGYALVAAIILAVEIVIALFIRDAFIRPIFGDVLAVMLVYCALLSVFEMPRYFAAWFAFFVGVAIELMQYLGMLSILGLEDNPLARVVLGTTFTWEDIAAYAAGAIAAFVIDNALTMRRG